MYREDTWTQVRPLHATGASKAAIARSLGMSRTTVQRLLNSEHPPTYDRGFPIDDEALSKLARALLAFAYEQLKRRNRSTG